MSESNLVQRYLQLAHSEDADDRAEAARELKNFLRNESACIALADLLGDADWRVRRAAVESFVEMRPHQAIPALLMSLYDEENAGRRNAAIDVLTRYGRDILPFLQAHLNSENLDVRMFLINILGELRDDSFLPFINDALRHTDGNIVSAAILALGKIGHPESVAQLRPFLAGSDLWLTFQAIDAAGEMQDSSLIPELARLYANPQYRKAVIHSLARFHHPAAYQALSEGLVENESVDVDVLQSLLSLFQSPAPAELKKEEQQLLREEIKSQLSLPGKVASLIRTYEQAGKPLRAQILQVLGMAQSAEAVPLLLDALRSPELQETAAQALVDADSVAVAGIVERLRNGDLDEDEQALLLSILSMINITLPLPDHQRWLSNENSEIRLQAYRLLSRGPVTGAGQWFIAGMFDSSPAIQDFSREPLLERCRSSKSFRAEVAEKMRGQIRSELPNERASALEILTHIEGESSFPLLFEALKDEDSIVRQKAVSLMGSGYHHEFQRFLIAALADEDPRVREVAARALRSYSAPEVVDALISTMHDEALWVRIATCESLAAIGADSAVPVFLQQIETETPIARAVLLRNLGQFRHSQTKESILKHLNSDDPEIRKAACQSLRFFNDSDIVFRLFTLMQNDPDWGVRVEAIRSLTAIRPFRLQEALLERLRADQDPFVRKEILGSLNTIGIDHLPNEIFEFLLDRHLADSAYEFLSTLSSRFAKQIREAAALQSPGIRRILRTIAG